MCLFASDDVLGIGTKYRKTLVINFSYLEIPTYSKYVVWNYIYSIILKISAPKEICS